MKSRDFCFWLQGHLELADGEAALDTRKVDLIKRHLALVFKHEIDPVMGGADHQAELNATHGLPDGANEDGEVMRC